MENVNHVTVAGHLVKSAELRYTTTGKPVAPFVNNKGNGSGNYDAFTDEIPY